MNVADGVGVAHVDDAELLTDAVGLTTDTVEADVT